ncbi:ATP-binding cassette domain-containing protein [Candidatus Igneacidithiobacillus taiwanensis]|uniref:ATP-binding cassette domain-containing protein n=1 Tax=Candidatus Igneacidithiobacillus taiwanensis TaxID=1945924 RepID=UPI0028996BCD|nr:ATP-binding cassette domain-containing protein [Candidatus Igneacidithiobacillus taiwanensis]
MPKTFTLHLRGGEQRVALAAPAFQLRAGECLVLRGPSGAGKSTLLRCIYGTYRADGGSIRLRYADTMTEIVAADPRHMLDLRSWQMAYASQFLRIISPVPSIDLVAEAALAQRVKANAALVLAVIQRAKLAGRGILAILHDPQQIARVADREIFLSPGEKPA